MEPAQWACVYALEIFVRHSKLYALMPRMGSQGYDSRYTGYRKLVLGTYRYIPGTYHT